MAAALAVAMSPLATAVESADSMIAYHQCLRDESNRLEGGIIDLDFGYSDREAASGIVAKCRPLIPWYKALTDRLRELGLREPEPSFSIGEIEDAMTHLRSARIDIQRAAYLNASTQLKETIDRETERLNATPNLLEIFLAATGHRVGLTDGVEVLFEVVQAAYPDQALGQLAEKHGLSWSNRILTLQKLAALHPDRGVRVLLFPFKNVARRADAIARVVHDHSLPFPENMAVRAGRIIANPLTWPISLGLFILIATITIKWSHLMQMQRFLRTPARMREPDDTNPR
jgi:hypothetical protein